MRPFLTSALLLTSFYALVFVIERTPRMRFRPLSFRRRFFASDATWFGIVIAMSAVSMLVLRPLLERITVEPIARTVRDLPALGRFGLALLLFDVVAYGVHRGMHRSDLLWNVHKVHHSSLQLDAVATSRQHMVENLLRFIPGQVAMFLIGIPAAQAAPAVAVGAAFAVIDHSNLNIDVRFVEKLFVTPRLHRRHHIPSTTMKNFGGVLSIWDRLFGTFVSMDTAEDERFGCPGEIDTYPQRFADSVRQPPRDIAAQLRARRVGVATSASDLGSSTTSPMRSAS